MEADNNRELDEIHRKMLNLKGLAQDIHNHVEEDNKILSGLSDSMDKVKNVLGRTMDQLNNLMQTGGSQHMCALVAFAIAVFFLLWLLLKMGGS